MKIKLSKVKLEEKPEIVGLKDLEKILDDSKNSFIYLDKDNDSKTLKSIVKHFEKRSYFVHLNRVKYGLTKDEIIHEFHIFK